MELNFDKEIDALLRQAARGENFLNEHSPAHADADEISAFAENALPQAAKMRVTEHLADCAICRKILASVIALNDAAEAVPAKETVEKAIPWYERLFAFPQIAYTMGALALIFSGVIGILVYQSAERTASFEMVKAPASEPAGRGPNAEGIMPEYQEQNQSPSNMTMTNANAAATPQTSMANTSANGGAAESRTFSANTANANTVAANTAKTENLARESGRKDQLMTAPPKPEAPADAEVLRDEEKREVARAAEKDAPDKKVMQKAPAPSSGSGLIKEDNERAKLRESETRQVSGKTFNRKDGVWYDAAYRGQGTINIRRKTEEYRKLEKGLRIIAESLEGTVVVVWNEKAYRIQ